MKFVGKKKPWLLFLTIFALIFLWTTSTALANGYGKSLAIKGHVCHGANYYNGAPLSDYANTESFLPKEVFAFWNNFAVPEVGVMDPNDPRAIADIVKKDTPLNYIMATFDPGGGFGLPAPKELLNVPINEAHVLAGPPLDPRIIYEENFQTKRFQIPGASDTRISVDLVRNKAWEKPVTLKEWNKASGWAYYSCDSKGNGYVYMELKKLRPFVPYTMWEVRAVNDRTVVGKTNQPFLQPGLPIEVPIAPGPFGGIPNTIVADRHGNAVYERELHYCPLDTESNPIMYNAAFLHWDNNVYGAWFDQSGVGYPIGVVAGDHVCFSVGNHLLEAKKGHGKLEILKKKLRKRFGKH